MYRIIFTLSFILASLAASAQQSGGWTLRQCIDYALENNITVKQQDVTRRQNEVQLSTAKNSRLPDLNASASQNWSFGRGLTSENTYSNRNTSSTSLSLGTTVPLFTGFRIPRTIELNKLNLEAATADLGKARDDISVQVAQAYVQILYNIELRDVAQRQIDIDSMQVERLREMYCTGKASGVEVAQQEATLAQSRLTLTQADNDYRISLLTLAQLLELPSPEGFTIVRPDIATLTVDEAAALPLPDEIFQEAIAFKPEVKAETLRLKSTEMSIKIAQSALWPTLSLSAGLGSNYYKTNGFDTESFGRQMRNNFSQYIGLSLNIPIFNRFETRNSIRSARLDRESQQLRLDDVKKTLYKEIQQAYYNAVAARAQYASSTEATASNKAAFDLMSAKYEYGKANITEFNESKNNWLKAESDLARAKYEYMYDTSLLDFYRGRPLDF
ncbi:TolC family protein [Marseilla massiliensis]|uniref:TolC family protein n=1 Tax=Marseilla massiliensis TaxID=1841864 RepID=A0A938WT23_9BACT|nr:TolC family protein [Marseilla massiliensis]MBM6673698.1 TolC family protein [Marseilla massiliensis]